MILNFLIWIIAAVIDGLVLGLCGLYTIWWADLIGVICLPILFLLVFGALLFVLFFVGLIIKTKKECKPNKVAYWFTFQINYILCLLTCNIKVINKEAVPKDSRFLLVFNHRSNWDPMVLMKVFMDRKLFFVTKPSNMDIPIAGPFMQRAGFIPINRENNKEGLKAILKAVNIIKTNLGSIGIAPEGTRNKKLETPLLEFHAGSLKIAYKSEVPIVVTTLKHCEDIHKNFPFKRTKVVIEVLEVLKYEDYKDKDTIQLSQEIYDLMEKNIIGKEN